MSHNFSVPFEIFRQAVINADDEGGAIVLSWPDGLGGERHYQVLEFDEIHEGDRPDQWRVEGLMEPVESECEGKAEADRLMGLAISLGFKAAWIAEEYPDDYCAQAFILRELIEG